MVGTNPKHEPRRRSTRNAGFTLMELCAVIAVLGILAAAATPAVWWMSVSRSGGAARLLLHDLTYARESAMNSGTTSWVSFDVGANTVSVLAEDPDSPGLEHARLREDPATGWAYVRRFGVGEFPGVRLVSASFDGGTSVGFDWLGRPLHAGGAALGVRGEVSISDGFGCVVEPGTGLAWVTSP